jgi:hypothetical protein
MFYISFINKSLYFIIKFLHLLTLLVCSTPGMDVLHKKSVMFYSNLWNTFFPNVLCDFTYLLGCDDHIMHIQLYC